MKKRIIFILIAVLAVSFSSTGFTALKAKKQLKKVNSIVLAKGLQINWCGNDVKDNGSVTIPGLEGVTLPVKNGKFDLTVSSNPVFGDEWGLRQQSDIVELDFGSAKVYPFYVVYFSNGNTKGDREDTASGRGSMGVIYYSDRDVKGVINGKPAELKKGWNILGQKTNLKVNLMCAG